MTLSYMMVASTLGHWLWCNPRNLDSTSYTCIHLWACTCVRVCVCVCVCVWVSICRYACSSMLFCQLCSFVDHHHQDTERFHHTPPFPSLWWPLICSLSLYNFVISGMLHKQNYTVCNLLRWTFFTQHNSLQGSRLLPVSTVHRFF